MSQEPESLELTRCPKCQGPTDTGYGLMGGGVGPYVFCAGDEAGDDGCGWFYKEQDLDD